MASPGRRANRFPLLAVLAVVVVTAGCATPVPREGDSAAPRPSANAGRALVMAFRYELTSLSPKTAQAAGGQMNRLFNAGLSIVDSTATPRPQLAESVPQLASDSWQVLPNGEMRTTFRLRPNLAWHDGQPLTAEDFVFAWHVYSEPQLAFTAKPQDQMREVTSVDPRTLSIRWRTPYPDAADLALNFVPLPRHLLEQSFGTFKADADDRAFLQQPYWTTEFIGVGPYRLATWVPGSQMEGLAFEDYAFGRPKIDRIVARIFGDENTVLANVLSKQVDFAVENTMRFEHGSVLKREWSLSPEGTVQIWSSGSIVNLVQFRREFLKEPTLLDLRVRRAIAFSVDKRALQDGLYEGEGEVAHAAVSPEDRFYPAVSQGVTKYPYDPRETERLMNEAGLTKDREGFFANPAGERLQPEFQSLAGTTFERGLAILTDTFWRSGLQFQPAVMSAVQVRDNLARASFPGIGMALSGGASFTTAEIGTAANRWNGANRGGWSNPEYDRLFEAFNTTLDLKDRTQRAVDYNQLLSDELPGFVMYYDVKVSSRVNTLRGPEAKGSLWNLQEWEIR